MSEQDVRNTGLRGVTVADTRISLVDGQRGILHYRGYGIEELARHATFEEVVYLLLEGKMPSRHDHLQTQRTMASQRSLPRELMNSLLPRLGRAAPMDVLQHAYCVMGDDDPLVGTTKREEAVESSLRLIARTGTLASSWLQAVQGREPLLPDPELSHAAEFLRGIRRSRPTADEVRLMDTLLILHMEHAFNASTFACREVASTRAHLYASVAAGAGALSGALHGGANSRAMKMLMEIGSIDAVESWARGRVEAGQRIMGLGHAIYKTEDPRAAILREFASRVLEGRPEEAWFQLALKTEEVARRLLREKRGLDLYPNVDFYSGPILYALGIPVEMFTVFFAVARCAGWCAHFVEEQFAEAQPKPAIYRPESHYIGRYCGEKGCSLVPYEARGEGCPRGVEGAGCDEATTRD